MVTDLVAAWRQLRRSPAHVVIVVISLGVGMAVSAAAFSVMNALAFEERPGIDTRSGLLNIRWNAGAGLLLSEQDFEVIDRDLGTVFSAAAAEARRSVPVVLPREPITAPASFVSPLYFEALGTQPAHGRLLTPYDAAPDAPAAALIGERLWRESFGASAEILGRPITIGGRPFTIVGVTPAEFSGLIPRDVGQGEGAIPQVWLPLRHYATPGGPLRSVPSLSVAGRLRAGVPVKRALAEIAVVASRLTTDRSKHRNGVSLWGYRAGIDWSENPIEVAAVLGVFLFVPLAVLAIGCANVFNLQLARATERSRELGVRLALGASRGRLARLLGLEVVFLAALAGLAGWRGAVVLLLVAAPYLQVPVTVDPEALIFVFVLAVGVIAVSGFAPAWIATRHAIAAGLKTSDGGIQHKRLRAALVVLQVAVSLLFLFISALGVRTLHAFVPSLPPGADKAAVARFDLAASHPGLRDSRPFLDGMLERLAGAPEITAAGFADFVHSERGVWYWGRADGGDVRGFAAGGHVTPGWFDAFGARSIMGRGFDRSDMDRATAIVNEAMAATLTRGPGSPLGRTLRVSYSADGPQRSVEIVGVVADHLTLQSGRGAPAVYLPMPRVSPASIVLVARASDLPAGAAAIKLALAAVDPEIPWVTLTTLEGASGDPLKGLRSGTWIGGGLGLSALVIAAIGLHAVLAYVIRRRTHEIGIRLAVGADRKAIVWLVLRQGLGLVLAGTVLGLAAAVPLGHMLRAGFVGLSPVDPVALLAPVLLLFLVGLLAAAVPALRAASVDPIVVLREP